ncbi:unnamed protein product, partial [Allacma fusca]
VGKCHVRISDKEGSREQKQCFNLICLSSSTSLSKPKKGFHFCEWSCSGGQLGVGLLTLHIQTGQDAGSIRF